MFQKIVLTEIDILTLVLPFWLLFVEIVEFSIDGLAIDVFLKGGHVEEQNP